MRISFLYSSILILSILSLSSSLLALTPGTTKWVYETGNQIYSSPAIGTDNTIYIGSDDNKLHSINHTTGLSNWTFATGGNIRSSPAIGSDGTIYVGSDDEYVYAINPDGTQKWKYHTWADYDVENSPVIGTDGTIYIAVYDMLFALHLDTGEEKWTYFLDSGDFKASPAIAEDGTIYIPSTDSNKLYAIYPDGTDKWASSLSAAVWASSVIGDDGTIYTAAINGDVCAISSTTGNVNWTFSTDVAISKPPVIDANGIIYTTTWNGTLYALNPDCTKKWELTVPGTIASVPVIDSDGILYIGKDDNKIYAIHPDTGAIKWTYTGGGNFADPSGTLSSAPTIDQNGILYTGCRDGKVYALYASTTSTGTSSGWPMFLKNPLHTGRIADNTETFTIEGYTKESSTIPIQCSTITLTGINVTTKTYVTENDGRYIFTNLSIGDYEITAENIDYTFTSSTKNYVSIYKNYTEQNFQGAVTTYTITGYIRDKESTAIQGATVTLSGVSDKTYLTDSSGSYSFSELVRGSYTINCQHTEYLFTPNDYTYNQLTSDKTNQNFTGTSQTLLIATNGSLGAGPISFGEIKAIDSKSDTFTISNVGGGMLQGSISCNTSWIKLSTTTFSISTSTTITATIHRYNFNREGEHTGTIYIQSNGGNASFSVSAFVQSNTQDAFCHPNPIVFSKGQKLNFKNISSNSTVKIITPAGHLVRTFHADASGYIPPWNGYTEYSERVASGTYIVHILDEKGKYKLFNILVKR